MKRVKLIRNTLAILTVTLICLAFYTYRNAPVAEEIVEACPICPAFSVVKVKDTSTARSYAIASTVSGSLLIGTVFYLRKTKKAK